MLHYTHSKSTKHCNSFVAQCTPDMTDPMTGCGRGLEEEWTSVGDTTAWGPCEMDASTSSTWSAAEVVWPMLWECCNTCCLQTVKSSLLSGRHGGQLHWWCWATTSSMSSATLVSWMYHTNNYLPQGAALSGRRGRLLRWQWWATMSSTSSATLVS